VWARLGGIAAMVPWSMCLRRSLGSAQCTPSVGLISRLSRRARCAGGPAVGLFVMSEPADQPSLCSARLYLSW